VGDPGTSTPKTTSLLALLPHEHGAYSQLAFPLLTALLVAGLSTGGLLIALAAVAVFLAHEPAAVLLGLRGVRIKRERGPAAVRWLSWWLAAAAAAGIGAVLAMPAGRWSLAVPIVPAAMLATATAIGREKSAAGEVAAAIAFASIAVPVCVAGGASAIAGIVVAVPFALLFVASTLAVRVVILRVRGGGDPRATRATRRIALGFSLTAVAALAALAAVARLPWSVLVASVPGLALACATAIHPPAPARLRTLGWTLVAVTLMTAAIIVVTE
jgi:hypothetical protein